MSEALKVLVTGAAGQIGYSLVSMVANGNVFGPNQKIILVMLDIEPMMKTLNGVVMELADCAYPCLEKVIATHEYEVAFKDIDIAMLVGAMPRKQGMERSDLLKANVKIFEGQGQALDKFAKKTVKVVVVGNPANTNALVCSQFAPSISPKNFSALTRLDQNRSKAQIAEKCGVTSADVNNTIIWGNHSATQYPDVSHATVNVSGKVKPAKEAVNNDSWLQTEFISVVQKRGAAVIAARGLSSAMSAAKATCDHIRDWWFGTQPGSWTSMAVISDGSYDIAKGLMYSFPVEIDAKTHDWKIVQGLSIDEFSREKMKATENELQAEKDDAFKFCGIKG